MAGMQKSWKIRYLRAQPSNLALFGGSWNSLYLLRVSEQLSNEKRGCVSRPDLHLIFINQYFKVLQLSKVHISHCSVYIKCPENHLRFLWISSLPQYTYQLFVRYSELAFRIYLTNKILTYDGGDCNLAKKLKEYEMTGSGLLNQCVQIFNSQNYLWTF